jgi:hypothetical protein
MLLKPKNLAPMRTRTEIEEDPAFVRLTAEERQAKPELLHVESLLLFTTKTGVTLVCLTTDRKLAKANQFLKLVKEGYV